MNNFPVTCQRCGNPDQRISIKSKDEVVFNCLKCHYESPTVNAGPYLEVMARPKNNILRIAGIKS